ncbi:hypothetical protein [Cellulomonas palmilytica]|uniref:hypothetical protein n=1 Tax=Cellulomonas palmilytica TaxID=2608402 RepID=UPI001F39A96F|nr:hypothetical protein [Cellulomonas palmilytica]UJP39981.1 hypothetical protein F1D97_17220 [Cellulomonas palmilytica]
MTAPTNGHDEPGARLDERALAREIRADARAERRVLVVGIVAAAVTAPVVVLLSTLR